MISWDPAVEIQREVRAVQAAVRSGDLSGLSTEPFRRPETDLSADRNRLERLLTELGETIDLVAEARDRTAADLDAARARRLAGHTYRHHTPPTRTRS